ncbi:MAG: flippase-like domain-containing protein [Burkholderiales bacterium]|nr:flippase-like domain-containing protein [Phycisphaerae bacterium]
MPKNTGKILRFVLRWTIAVVGIAWVVSNLHLHDRIRVLDANDLPVEVRLMSGTEYGAQFEYLSPIDGRTESVSADRVINGPDRKTVSLGGTAPVQLLGMRLIGDIDKKPLVRDLLIKDPQTGHGRFIPVTDVPAYALDIPQPRIERGAITMMREANPRLLAVAVAVVPITFLCTTIRWSWLLRALGIGIPFLRVLTLTMVGAFYNTFMPGSTGGDVIKAYYAAKQAPQRRTAAVMSVIIDRIIGLLALIMLGGTMAALQYASADDKNNPVARACLRVALAAAILLGITSCGIFLVYAQRLRQALGLNALVRWLPMQDKLSKIIEVVRVYRGRQTLMFWTLIITFPVHITVIVSTMLAGHAFGLPISPSYYFIVVPVVVLVGAIPLSPQGVGVMEAFAFYLTRQQGATVNQALALTMSIRLLQIVWNLVGGLFVLRGGYQTPTQREQDDMESLPSTAVEPS